MPCIDWVEQTWNFCKDNDVAVMAPVELLAQPNVGEEGPWGQRLMSNWSIDLVQSSLEWDGERRWLSG